MSRKDAEQFYAKLEQKDEKLRQAVRKAVQEVLDAAKKDYKLDFTKAELHDVVREKLNATKMPPSGQVDEPACVAFSARPGF